MDSRHEQLAVSERAAVDRAVSFVVGTLFDTSLGKHDLLLCRSLFLPVARITIVPRDRPVLAAIVNIDELLEIRAVLFAANGTWKEAFRTHEDTPDGCIRVHVNLANHLNANTRYRTADLLFVVGGLRVGWVIRSCNVVYDETFNASSPITLILQR